MIYFSKIISIRETEKGTDLIINIPGEKLRRKISKYIIKGNNGIDAEIRINDGRTISNDQRRKIFATVRDIGDYLGYDPEYLKQYFKYDYCAATGEDYFSLSDCSITTARNFINHIIDFVLAWDIPLKDPALERTDDIDRYIYGCLKNRKCAITGDKKADVHHCVGSTVGMGRNRKKINHKGLKIIPLNREWHNKVHKEGEKDIFKRFKIYGIIVDDETLEELGLNYEDIT